MLTMRVVVLVSAIVLCAAHPLAAQPASWSPPLTIAVREIVADSTGREFSVCSIYEVVKGSRSYAQNCARSIDSTHFRFDSLPARVLTVSVSCAQQRAFSVEVASLKLDLTSAVSDTSIMVTSRKGCDPRKLRREVGNFSGLYTPEFESSAFVPCRTGNWLRPGDVDPKFDFMSRAWLYFTNAGDRSAGRLKWPSGPPIDSYGTRTFFLQVHGTMTGPGHYGHMGVSGFQLDVDSVITVSLPSAVKCR